jgi:hypothetical protein
MQRGFGYAINVMYTLRMTRRNNIPLVIIFLALAALLPIAVHADAPVITSLTASPSSISNEYSFAIAWNESSGTGIDLKITCPTGVTLRTTGGTFPCGTRVAESGTSGEVALTATNVSGATQTLYVTAYPKDSGGVSNDGGAMNTSLTVSTAPQTVTDFSVSNSSPISGTQVTFTWKGVYTPGVNLMFDCQNGVSFYTADPAISPGTVLPCGTPAFSSSLPTTGSQIVFVKGSTFAESFSSVYIYPAITTGLYDSTHALKVSLTTRPAPAPATPTITSVNLSAINATAGKPLTITWNATGVSGVNLEFDCSGGISVFDAASSSTAPLPCNVAAFASALSANGTTTVNLSSTSPVPQYMNIVVIPKGNDGTYYKNYARTVAVTVYPAGAITTSISTQQLQTPASILPAPAQTAVAAHAPFTTPLTRGSKGAAVTALQNFLSLNTTLYPEASVTGFYGPATERAVQRFQVKHGVAKLGDVGYGSVGPKTRAKMNTLTTP